MVTKPLQLSICLLLEATFGCQQYHLFESTFVTGAFSVDYGRVRVVLETALLAWDRTASQHTADVSWSTTGRSSSWRIGADDSDTHRSRRHTDTPTHANTSTSRPEICTHYRWVSRSIWNLNGPQSESVLFLIWAEITEQRRFMSTFIDSGVFNVFNNIRCWHRQDSFSASLKFKTFNYLLALSSPI